MRSLADVTIGRAGPLDRRQRLAAAALLMAFDGGLTLGDAADLMREAAEVCPGLASDEVPICDRRAGLSRARDLIDTMLAEIG